jgi:hypothetical protein
MPQIYVMTDDTGSWPMIWSEGQPPKNQPGRRTWRFVAEVEEDQILPVLEALDRTREAGEL